MKKGIVPIRGTPFAADFGGAVSGTTAMIPETTETNMVISGDIVALIYRHFDEGWAFVKRVLVTFVDTALVNQTSFDAESLGRKLLIGCCISGLGSVASVRWLIGSLIMVTRLVGRRASIIHLPCTRADAVVVVAFDFGLPLNKGHKQREGRMVSVSFFEAGAVLLPF